MTSRSLDRRDFVTLCAGLGLGATALPAVLAAVAETRPIDDEVLRAAAVVAGVELTESERALMLAGVAELRQDFERLRSVPLPNAVVPALRFDPTFGVGEDRVETSVEVPAATPPSTAAVDLAFGSISELAAALRAGSVTSVELTALALDRIRRLDPQLEAVITVTEERALDAAARADRELASGRDRGPLHGIPWGAKDLLAVAGYPTTWGAKPFAEQRLDSDATVVSRLDEAGAVLVAKLTLGALAWGDVWFGGTTKNPWNLEQGSSGSSAGPGAATAAGLVPFAIGSETWGSIVSPSTRCGVSGLRPTFGRVSRHGAMALSWSMDKLGPMARSVDDCALVMGAVLGRDGEDPTVVERPFVYDARRPLDTIRVGWVPELFEAGPDDEDADLEWRGHDRAVIDVLRDRGVELEPVGLPELPVSALSFILTAEAAAAFDELTRSGLDDELVRQIENAWPNVFRQGRLIPAVEYLQANRVRTLIVRELEERVFSKVDVYVTPSYGGDNLLLTNLTGHPQVVVPNGFRSDGTPTSITFTGRFFGEAEALLVARAFQSATDWHRRRPPMAV